MYCTKCGKELNDEWKICPYCQAKVMSSDLTEAESITEINMDGKKLKKYKFNGVRRTGRFGFKYLESEAEISGNNIKFVTPIKMKKKIETNLKKDDIASISFNIQPVIGMMDIIRFIIFAALIPFSYGMSLFGLALFVKFTLVKHAVIQLADGRKVKIPIRQNADMVEILSDIGYDKAKVAKLDKSRISEKKISVKEWMTTVVLLLLAVITIPFGMKMYAENMNVAGNEIQETESEVRTLEEVGGYDEWKNSGYVDRVRTSIGVGLPIADTTRNNYLVWLGDSPGNVIVLIREDEASVKEWEWLQNAEPFMEEMDTAYFDVTLTYLRDVNVEDNTYPLFIFEDPEPYQGEELQAMKKEPTLEDYINSCTKVDAATLERNPEAYIGENIIVEGYLGETMGVLTVGLWSGHPLVLDNECAVYDVNLKEIGNVISGDYGFVAGEFLGDGEISGKAIVVTASDDGVGGTDSALEQATGVSDDSVNTTVISEYVNEVGYWGELSGAYIYFGEIDGNTIEISVADEMSIMDWYTGTIINERTIEFESEGCMQTIYLEGDGVSFEIEGNPGMIDFSGVYWINAG